MVAERGPEGRSIQLQIALVPSSDIEIVPGTHLRWDNEEEYAIRCADGRVHNRSNSMPNALRVEMEAGDAVAFNPMALHRGRYHADKLRRTFMLTYTSASHPRSDFFSYQPWFLEENYLGDYPSMH
jgi:ectoine hydroxylase-related dioxygenase (phytanoyl-CoA dioxygenase family)